MPNPQPAFHVTHEECSRYLVEEKTRIQLDCFHTANQRRATAEWKHVQIAVDTVDSNAPQYVPLSFNEHAVLTIDKKV